MPGPVFKSTKAGIIAAVTLSIAIRLAIAPIFDGFQYDMDSLADWSWHLQFTPMSGFYEFASSPDHLPGDLWFLWWLGTVFRAFGGENFESDSYRLLIKVVPTLADAAIGLLIFSIVSRLKTQRTALLAAIFYLFNPAVIFLAAVWGQWDPVSMALVVFGMWIVMTRTTWLWAIPFLAWAVVIKPPLAPLCGLIILIPLWKDFLGEKRVTQWFKRSAFAIVVAGMMALTSVLIVIIPFSVGLPGMATSWQLLDRMQVAIDLYPFKTLSATNIWMLGQGSLDRRSDETDFLFGVSAHDFGNVLLVLAMLAIVVVVCVLAFRRRQVSIPATITWLMLLASIAFFMLPTRVHERYLFPAMVCFALLVGLTELNRYVVWLATGMSLTYLINLVIVYGGFRSSVPNVVGDFLYGPALVILSLVNIGLFIGACWVAFNWTANSDAESQQTMKSTS